MDAKVVSVTASEKLPASHIYYQHPERFVRYDGKLYFDPALPENRKFIADVVNVRADQEHLNRETGKLELAETNPLVYVHGGYFELGAHIGKFGWSVEKKNKK